MKNGTSSAAEPSRCEFAPLQKIHELFARRSVPDSPHLRHQSGHTTLFGLVREPFLVSVRKALGPVRCIPKLDGLSQPVCEELQDQQRFENSDPRNKEPMRTRD